MLFALAAIPVVASAVLGLVAPTVGGRLAPATAVRLLVAAAWITASATCFSLAVLALNAVTENRAIARIGHLIPTVDPDDGTPPPIGGAVLLLLIIVLLLATTVRFIRVIVATMQARRACRDLAATADGIAIVESGIADAFAVPELLSRSPRIVVTSAMLAALGPVERRILIAHEKAHVTNRHHVLVQLAELASGADPLLIPVARQVRVLTERWADEEAAAVVGDRRLAAIAVARAALARTRTLRQGQVAENCAALNATTTGVPDRVRALSRPRPDAQPRYAGVLLTLGLAAVIAAGSIAVSTHQKFERAASETIVVHGKVVRQAELGDHDGDERHG